MMTRISSRLSPNFVLSSLFLQRQRCPYFKMLWHLLWERRVTFRLRKLAQKGDTKTKLPTKDQVLIGSALPMPQFLSQKPLRFQLLGRPCTTNGLNWKVNKHGTSRLLGRKLKLLRRPRLKGVLSTLGLLWSYAVLRIASLVKNSGFAKVVWCLGGHR